MLSSRRIAQLGLSAASLTLVASVAVLIAGAADQSHDTNTHAEAATTAHVTPLAASQLVNISSDRIASAK